jgi:hypothetical protein
MSEVNPPYAVTGTTAEEMRQFVQSVVRSEGTGPRTSPPFEVTASGSDMTFTLGDADAFVLGDATDVQGMYHVVNDGDAPLELAASDLSNGRIDLVVAHVYDQAYGDGETAWHLEVIEGTPSGTPSPPALPDTALELYQVTVPAGAANAAACTFANKMVAAAVGFGLAARVYRGGSDPNFTDNAFHRVEGLVADAGDDPFSFLNPDGTGLLVPAGYGGRFVNIVEHASFDTESTGDRQIDVRVNGSSVGRTNQRACAGAFSTQFDAMGRRVFISDGDTIELWIWHSAGHNIHVNAGRFNTYISLEEAA